MTKALASAAGNSAVNLGKLINVCTTNALGRVMVGRRVFGEGSGGEDANTKADEFKEMVVEVMVLAGVFNLGDFIPTLEWLDLQGVTSKMKKLHARFDAFLNGIIKEHTITVEGNDSSGDTTRKHVDLLSTLISLQDNADRDGDGEGGKLTDTEIKALLLVIFLSSPLLTLDYHLKSASITVLKI